MPGLGFRHVEDPRDKRFSMTAHLEQYRQDVGKYFPQGLPPGTRHYRSGPILDQGNTGTCTAFAWTARINGAPIMQALSMSPFDFYRKEVAIDEYDDNDAEATAPDDQLQSGTSVRAGAKVAKSRGLLTTYVWAGSVEDIRAWHLAGFGGMVFGTTWTSDMFTTDSDGFVNATGSVEGGHAYATHGWNDHVKHNGHYVRAVRCQNNWNADWGQGGFFWLAEEDIGKLFSDGEFCAPVEMRLSPGRAKSITTAWDYTRTDKNPAGPEPY